MALTEAVQQRIDKNPDLSVYVLLAKAGLWIAASVLVFTITTCVTAFVTLEFSWKGDAASGLAIMSPLLAVAVNACQVLVVIAISVLGYHGYQGSHFLHYLRHLKDEK